MEDKFDVIVIGGGAAGFFSAIQLAERKPLLKILIIEKSTKLLSKVRISGGGRCNVTHSCHNPFELARHYPRGERPLKDIFKVFDAARMVKWLEDNNVIVKTEPDGRIFPISDTSETIINCFVRKATAAGIQIITGNGVSRIERRNDDFHIRCDSSTYFIGRYVIIACGGNAKPSFYQWISELGHTIVNPIPSLFTLNVKNGTLIDLPGIAVPNASIRISKTSFRQDGPILITHWGFSGPAVIKLSAWAAEHLHSVNYNFNCQINWTGLQVESDVLKTLNDKKRKNPKQVVRSHALFDLPIRLWDRICALAEIPVDKIWSELPVRNLNKLLENLYRFESAISGKTTFKEEFVTCGGVDFKEVNHSSMESRLIPNLFFAGEVLNMDGETGGFNFQAAWSSGYIAADSIVKRVG